MAEDQTRIVRLSAILTHLQSKQLVTARELAEHYDVSVRTIYRDIRTLERAGIPIAVEEGRGYFLGEGFRLPPIMFTEDEALALVTVEQLLKRTQDKSLITNYKDAIIKIKSVLGNRQKANIEFVTDRLQVRTYTSESPSSHHLIELQQAIAHFRVVDIRYLSLK
ncbi:MAG: HTH domain-containing protein, partial [Bacteroidota bacterium]